SPLPSWCAVLGLVTRNRLRSQSTSFHFKAKCSEGHRRPPNRDRANSRRHSASRQASRTLDAAFQLTQNLRASFARDGGLILAKGFLGISSRSRADAKNCLAFTIIPATVAWA